nr:MAG TPA: hypothetical protein [Caudoviricetes sp.]
MPLGLPFRYLKIAFWAPILGLGLPFWAIFRICE